MQITTAQGVLAGIGLGVASGIALGVTHPMSQENRDNVPGVVFGGNAAAGAGIIGGGIIGVMVAAGIGDHNARLGAALMPVLGYGGAAFGGAAMLTGIGASYIAGARAKH
jgi:hypothetical protein